MGIPNDMHYIALGILNDMFYFAMGIQNDIFYFCNGRCPMLLNIGPSGCDKTPLPCPKGFLKLHRATPYGLDSIGQNPTL